MANHERQFPTGVPFKGQFPSAKAEAMDIALAKSVNGDDGSEHVGSVALGGLMAPHITLSGYFDDDVASTETVTCNLDQAGQFDLKFAAGVGTVTLDFQNVRRGDTIIVMGSADGLTPAQMPTLVWGGSGITHRHALGDDQFLKASNTEFCMWVGHAGGEEGEIIFWTVTRYE